MTMTDYGEDKEMPDINVMPIVSYENLSEESISTLSLKQGDVIFFKWVKNLSPSQSEISSILAEFDRVVKFIKEKKGIDVLFLFIDTNKVRVGTILSDSLPPGTPVEQHTGRMIRIV